MGEREAEEPDGIDESRLGREFRPSPSIVAALGGTPIRVGTENQAKLSAVREAFTRFVDASDDETSDSKLAIVSAAVESGVSEQPVGWDEITAGARNRARAALASGDCALAVGIEDGLVRLSEDAPREVADAVYNVGCAWITDGQREGPGYSSGFAYPTAILGDAFQGRSPIGDLFDDLWSRSRPSTPTGAEAAKSVPSGRSGGNIGRLTGGRLERAGYGSHAILCAMIRFLHTDLYD